MSDIGLHIACWQLQELGVPTARCALCDEQPPTGLYCATCGKPLTIVRAHAYIMLDDGAKQEMRSWHVVHALPECSKWRKGGLEQATCVPETPYGTTLDDFCKVGAS